MNHTYLIQQGLKNGLIRFEDDEKYIVYIEQNKRRNYNNPEEKVQAEAYLSLILEYSYPPAQVRQFVSVQMGSETKEADLIVYADALRAQPHIVVECKKQEVSEQEFARAIDQAYSYAVAEGATYVWVTSGLKDEYYEVDAKRTKARIPATNTPTVVAPRQRGKNSCPCLSSPKTT
jgi:type I restriction enzyme M protein